MSVTVDADRHFGAGEIQKALTDTRHPYDGLKSLKAIPLTAEMSSRTVYK